MFSFLDSCFFWCVFLKRSYHFRFITHVDHYLFSRKPTRPGFELCDKLEAERSRARGIRRDCEPKQRRSRLCWGPNNKGNCHVYFPLVKKLGRKTTLFLFGGGVGAQKKKFKVIFKTVLFVVRLIDVLLAALSPKVGAKNCLQVIDVCFQTCWSCYHLWSIRLSPFAICSMYGMFTYMSPKFMVNVGKYVIHGSYGVLVVSMECGFSTTNPWTTSRSEHQKVRKCSSSWRHGSCSYHLHVVFFELWWIDYGWIL